MEVGGDVVTFNMNEAMRFPSDNSELMGLNALDFALEQARDEHELKLLDHHNMPDTDSEDKTERSGFCQAKSRPGESTVATSAQLCSVDAFCQLQSRPNNYKVTTSTQHYPEGGLGQVQSRHEESGVATSNPDVPRNPLCQVKSRPEDQKSRLEPPAALLPPDASLEVNQTDNVAVLHQNDLDATPEETEASFMDSNAPNERTPPESQKGSNLNPTDFTVLTPFADNAHLFCDACTIESRCQDCIDFDLLMNDSLPFVDATDSSLVVDDAGVTDMEYLDSLLHDDLFPICTESSSHNLPCIVEPLSCDLSPDLGRDNRPTLDYTQSEISVESDFIGFSRYLGDVTFALTDFDLHPSLLSIDSMSYVHPNVKSTLSCDLPPDLGYSVHIPYINYVCGCLEGIPVLFVYSLQEPTWAASPLDKEIPYILESLPTVPANLPRMCCLNAGWTWEYFMFLIRDENFCHKCLKRFRSKVASFLHFT